MSLFAGILICAFALTTPALAQEVDHPEQAPSFMAGRVEWVDLTLDENALYVAYRNNQLNHKSRLNPDLIKLEKSYLDVRHYLSMDMTFNERVRGHARHKFKYFHSDKEESAQYKLDSGFLAYDVFPNVSLEAGRMNRRWGVAYGFDVVDIFGNTNRYISEDNDFKDAYLLQYFPSQNVGMTAVGFMDTSDYALKLNINSHDQTYGFYFLNQNDQPMLGADYSATVSDAVEIHGEVLLRQGSKEFYPRHLTEDIYRWEKTREESRAVYPQLVLGEQYTTRGNVNIALEYFYNGVGLNNKEYKTFQDGVDASLLNNKYQSLSVWRQFMMDVHQYYQFAEFGQNYLFARVSREKIADRFDLNMVTYYSIDEETAAMVPSVTYRMNDRSKVTLKGYYPVGSKDREFRRYYNRYVTVSCMYYF